MSRKIKDGKDRRYDPGLLEAAVIALAIGCIIGAISIILSGCEGEASYRIRLDQPKEIEPLPAARKVPNIPLINSGYSSGEGTDNTHIPHQGAH